MTDRYDPEAPDRTDPYRDLSDLTGSEPLPPLEDPDLPPATPPRSPLLTGLIIGLLLVALSVAFFQLLRSDDDTTAGGETTSTTLPPDDDADGDGSATTLPSGGETTTSTTVAVSFEPYTASGEPVSIEELTLTVSAIGPIEFGTGADEAIGRLISSLGEPDEDTGPRTSTGAFGICEGDTERIVRWGPLAAIVTVGDSGDSFQGYRLDLSYGGLNATTTEVATLSGLKAGDSVGTLRSTYDGFTIDFVVDPDLGEVFELRSSSTGNLLLWGPVTSTQTDGIVLGIYAPDVCGRV